MRFSASALASLTIALSVRTVSAQGGLTFGATFSSTDLWRGLTLAGPVTSYEVTASHGWNGTLLAMGIFTVHEMRDARRKFSQRLAGTALSRGNAWIEGSTTGRAGTLAAGVVRRVSVRHRSPSDLLPDGTELYADLSTAGSMTLSHALSGHVRVVGDVGATRRGWGVAGVDWQPLLLPLFDGIWGRVAAEVGFAFTGGARQHGARFQDGLFAERGATHAAWSAAMGANLPAGKNTIVVTGEWRLQRNLDAATRRTGPVDERKTTASLSLQIALSRPPKRRS